jgi:MoaA/NifB/PqqE/SkfB family radical SAM enzyme
MNFDQALAACRQEFDVVAEIDLAQWGTDYAQGQQWLETRLREIHRDTFAPQELIVVLHSHDVFTPNSRVGLIFKNLQVLLNEVDISNYFVRVLSSDPNIDQNRQWLLTHSTDTVPLTLTAVQDQFHAVELEHHPASLKETYQYGSSNPLKINIQDLSQRERELLTESQTFCMYPWIHLHAFPTGDAHPCCYSEMAHRIGHTKENTLAEIWNDRPMRDLRVRMLNNEPSGACKKCYEQEAAGFFSGRQSANKHHGHHVQRALNTRDDGHLDQFEMTYWDIRFSNLCNLSCRSCGHIFSSSWYKDQSQLAGPEWAKRHQVLNFAGRTQTDIWEQLVPHLDYVEQIYFAGGEPLMMDEHYRILEELERRGRFDVRLIYNTNFTQVRLKDRLVFDYWKRFDSVSVGASLDDMGTRGEYIRKGTRWAIVEANREQMMQECPRVDFYISPTLSILNAWSLPDFHRNWVERGLIRPQDLNVNILQDPAYYRIDIAPNEYKQRLTEKYQQHIEWLRPRDSLERASVGFESAVTFMNSTDNTHLIDSFWRKTHELDAIRNEQALDIIPELKALL